MTQESLLKTLEQPITLHQMQEYVKNVIELRGFAEETPSECLLMLVEEVGELAKAMRKSAGMYIDPTRLENYDTVQSEVADVFILLVSLCNAAGIDLHQAVLEKEKTNSQRQWVQV